MFDLKDKNPLLYLALITQVGLSIITPILLGVFLGNIVDKWLKTESIFTIIFIILGTVAGFMNLLKLATKKDHRK